MRKARFLHILLALGMIMCVSIAWAQTLEQGLTRLFSFDPHPSSAEFAEPAPFKGELLKHDIVFHETWKSAKNKDLLQTIRFTLRVLKNGNVLESTETEPFKVTNLTKGQKVAEAKLGGNILAVTVVDFEKAGAGISDVTLAFTLSYPEIKVEKAEAKVANRKTSNAIDFCQKLVDRADAIPASNIAARLNLYKKAVSAAPTADSSPEAADFHARIGKLVSELESGAPAAAEVKTAEQAKAPEISSDQTAPVIQSENPPAAFKNTPGSAPASAETAGKVNPAAKELFNQARALFAQEKGPEGREALRKALEIAPDYREALVLMGDNAYGNRKYARAKEAFDKVINLNDKDADSLLKYFKACYYLGEGSDAVMHLAAIKDKYPTDSGIKLSLVESYFQLGDLINAEAVCNEIIVANPGDWRAKDLLERIRKHMR